MTEGSRTVPIGYLFVSGLVHVFFLGFLVASSKVPVGGGPEGTIVVNLTSLGVGHDQSHGSRPFPGKPLVQQRSDATEKSPSAGIKPGIGEAHADVNPPAPPTGSQEGSISGGVRGGGGAINPHLFGAGGLDKVPALTEYREIEYPPGARKAGLEGEVVVKILIARDGRVEAVESVRSTDKTLELAVLAAVKQWRFEPPTVRGSATSIWMITPFRFKLK